MTSPMIQPTSPPFQSRIIDSWTFTDDCVSSPQDRSRYGSFRALCYFGAGLQADHAAALFGVSRNTVDNWQAMDMAPGFVWRTLLALAGEMEAIDRRWRGWFLQKGRLFAPDLADGFEPGQVRSLPLLRGAMDSYRAERDAARAAAAATAPEDGEGRIPPEGGTGPGMLRTKPASGLGPSGLVPCACDVPSPGDEPATPLAPRRRSGGRGTVSTARLEGRSPLGRGQGLKKTPDPARSVMETLPDQGTPAARRVEATRRIGQGPRLDRIGNNETCTALDALLGSGNDGRRRAGDGSRVGSQVGSHIGESLPESAAYAAGDITVTSPGRGDVHFDGVYSQVPGREPEAGAGGALPAPSAARATAGSRQGRIIDIMLNRTWISFRAGIGQADGQAVIPPRSKLKPVSRPLKEG